MKKLCALLLFLGMFRTQASARATYSADALQKLPPLIRAIIEWRYYYLDKDYENVKKEITKAKKLGTLEATNERGNAAIHHVITTSVRAHNNTLLRDLIRAGASVEAKNNNGETVLHHAARLGHVDVVGILLEAKASPDIRSSSGETPLSLALEQIYCARPLSPIDLSPTIEDKIVIAQTLLFAGARTDLHDAKSRYLPKSKYLKPISALHVLARDGEINILQTIARLGMYLHIKKSDDTTPLHEAGTAEVAQFLLAQGADVHALNTKKQTPLHTALNGEVALALLTAGADVHALDIYEQTPLHTAATPESASALLTAGARIDATDDAGDTPLHTAAAGNLCVARALLGYKPATTPFRIKESLV